jgi:Kef-type K+ transport system membrane component KefB
MIPFFFVYIATRLHIPLPQSGIIMFCIYTTLTLTIAALSWRFIESPLLKVKERFDF